jgi:uncharacterized phage protein (TIGR01671 family)
MRDIKFRAWDTRWPKNDPEFTIAVQGQPDIETLASFAHHYMWNQEDIDSGALVLMQYTGLKDKNGVEVYEGDILRATYKYKVVWVPTAARYIVEPVNPGQPRKSLSACVSHGKVIGNIYENPALLLLRTTS